MGLSVQWVLLFVVSGSSTEGSEVPYFDESCSDVPGCYCYLTGEEYQADCAGTSLHRIPQDLAYNITVLQMVGTALSVLDTDDLKAYPYLKVINLAGNRLSSVSSGSLDGLTSLESFSVRDNRLGTLPPDIVPPNSRLLYFDASENDLTQIPNFSDLTQLEEVRLSENRISTVGESPFSGCGSLKAVVLDRNNIASLRDSTFSGAPNLESLDLSNNGIDSLGADTFAGLTQLKDLVLKNNAIAALDAELFSGSALLRSLDLSDNRIASIHRDSFAELDSLQILNLNGNDLTAVPTVAFTRTSSLRALYLGHNPIPEVPEAAFSGIPSLVELFLDGMPSLVRLDRGALRDLASLERLSLANNPNLQEFTPDHLPVAHVPKIRTIYLNGDGFVFLDREIFDDKPQLQLVDLYDNKFNCSCDLKWMPRVVLEKVPWARHWATSSTPPQCYTPYHLRGWPIPSMVEQDMTCDPLDIVPVSPHQQTAHLRSAANISVHLYKGLPSSLWITPDEDVLVPYPAGEHPLNIRRFATWAIIENNTVEATLYVNNASVSDRGSYTVRATNIAGSQSLTFYLEVLPYELTTTTPFAETSEMPENAATWRTHSTTWTMLLSFWFMHHFLSRYFWR